MIPKGLRAGVYVDVENVARNGGRGMRFDTLRQYATRDGADAIRLNAYLAFDEERAGRDPDYRARASRYHFALRDVGFKVVERPVQWLTSDEGGRACKASPDIDLAVDMLLQSEKLDRVVLVSGDGDFVRVVRVLQNRGCRVEVIGFQSVSYELRCEADVFLSGYLIPGLLPVPVKTAAPVPAKPPVWGEAGSRVRGTCYHYNAEKGFGFLRYLSRLGDLTVTDTRDPESPYREAFFHRSQCPANLDLNVLPNRDMVFDFLLVPGREGKMEANELALVVNYSPHLRPSHAPTPASDSRVVRTVSPRPSAPPEGGEPERTPPSPNATAAPAWGRTGLDDPPAPPAGTR
jgi:uncharacterized LabA/DUF88 family protein